MASSGSLNPCHVETESGVVTYTGLDGAATTLGADNGPFIPQYSYQTFSLDFAVQNMDIMPGSFVTLSNSAFEAAGTLSYEPLSFVQSTQTTNFYVEATATTTVTSTEMDTAIETATESVPQQQQALLVLLERRQTQRQ